MFTRWMMSGSALITEQSKGIFRAKRSPKILHDFAYTAYVFSVHPDIVQDAKRRLKGNAAVRNEIENCVRRLLCHDVDGSVDGTIDIKADQFWDELKHFQNRKDACWRDEDEQFELGLLKWGVDVEELKKPVGPRRLFKCWIEDWENVMDNGWVMRIRLLNKYGGMVFDDMNVDPLVRMRMSSTKLKWIRREGWHAMAEPPDYVGDGDYDDKLLEPLVITEEVLIELIKNTMQPEDLNVRMVKEGDNKVEVKEGEEDEVYFNKLKCLFLE
eukprot:CCRYP_019747-RA/>CCRYP_019747-RA protein AED:0.40 eAED:0.36 QI:0/0/0/1/0/0/2/0/269